jgi:hypothetical protein
MKTAALGSKLGEKMENGAPLKLQRLEIRCWHGTLSSKLLQNISYFSPKRVKTGFAL